MFMRLNNNHVFNFADCNTFKRPYAVINYNVDVQLQFVIGIINFACRSLWRNT